MNERYSLERLLRQPLGLDWRLATSSHAPAFASFACVVVMSFSGLMPGLGSWMALTKVRNRIAVSPYVFALEAGVGLPLPAG